MIELLARYGQELTAKDANNTCTCGDDESAEDTLEDCPITSLAYLETKAQNTQTAPMNSECAKDEPCSVMYCQGVYQEEKPAKEIESFATSEKECECGQEKIPIPTATQAKPCAPVSCSDQKKQPVDDVCPVCKDKCSKEKKAPLYSLASEAAHKVYCSKPIEIELEEVQCPDLTRSQEQNLLDSCECESSLGDMATAVCSETTNQEPEEEDAATCPPCPFSPANPNANKIFPLADANDDSCGRRKEPEPIEEDNCMCNRQKEKSPRECE